MKRDHDAEWKRGRRGSSTSARRVSTIDGVDHDDRPAAAGFRTGCPPCGCSGTASKFGLAGDAVARTLFDGDPRVAVFAARHDTDPALTGVSVNPYMMAAGDEKVVADQLCTRCCRSSAARDDAAAAAAAAADLSGQWDVRRSSTRRARSDHAPRASASAATTSTAPIAATSSPATSRARSTATACGSAAPTASRAATRSTTPSPARWPATRWRARSSMGEYLGGSGRTATRARGRGLSRSEDSVLSHSLGLALAGSSCRGASRRYDLLLRGGHVIDPKNGLSAVRDVAIAGGKVAAVAPQIDPADAFKVGRRRRGLYVTPGLIDIHVHVFAGTGEKNSYAGDNSLYPDGYTLRVGRDDGGRRRLRGLAQLRGVQDARHRPLQTRVLAFLNIVGNGMRGGAYEQDLADMAAAPAAEMAKKYPGVIVGIKTAHYAGPEWTPVENAVEAGTLANIPVMVDFGADKPERPRGRARHARSCVRATSTPTCTRGCATSWMRRAT